MSQFEKGEHTVWILIGISFLAGMSTPLGGLIVVTARRLSRRSLTALLGMAAGIMLTVVVAELIPASLKAGGHTLFWPGVAGGWLLMWGLKRVVKAALPTQHDTSGTNAYLNMGLFIAIAIAIHDLPEGLAIGAGQAVEPRIGLMIALAIALHNIPEGMSVAAPMRMGGASRSRILFTTFLIGLVTPLGTAIAILLTHVANAFIALSLAFASGAMAFVVAQNILPEAWRADKRIAIIGTSVGSVLMMAIEWWHG